MVLPKPNRRFKNSIRPFGLISRRYFPLFPLIPHRCRSCFLGRAARAAARKRASSLILIHRQFVYGAGSSAAYFIHRRGELLSWPSKFRSRPAEERKMYGWTLSTTGRSLISNERAAAGAGPQTTLINRPVVVSKSS